MIQFKSDIFAKQVKHALIDSEDYSKLSLRELADKWGVSAPTLSRVFNGKKGDLETIITISFYLDIPIEYGVNYH